MKALLVVVLLVMVVIPAPPSSAGAGISFGPYLSSAVRVIDGDTIVAQMVVYPNLTVTSDLRIAGIDAPEIRGACEAEKARAREARDFLVKLLQESPIITVSFSKMGSFRRPLATIRVNGRDLAATLIDAGHAAPWDGGADRPKWCPGIDA